MEVQIHPEWSYFKSHRGYTIRTLMGPEELQKVQKLRNQVFGIIDGDAAERLHRRDLISLHLVAIEEATGLFVGAYRITHSTQIEDFDCSDFFDLTAILSRPGNKAELSYACVDEAHRNGAVIRMLLAGVRDYCQHRKIHTLFGSASLQTKDEGLALKTYDLLRQDKSMPRKERISAPLLKFYFHVGALILAPPLFDSDFNCFDYLMMLDLNSVSAEIWKRILGL